jgi:tetratricopeptide (TPR) repeat protein
VQRSEEAITAHQAVVAIFRETGDPNNEGTALNNLAVALQTMGRFEEAITALQDAAIMFRKSGDHDSERIALDDLEAARAAQRA